MDEALDRTGRCIGSCSHAAEGAILGEMTMRTWYGSGTKWCGCMAWLDEAQEIDRCEVGESRGSGCPSERGSGIYEEPASSVERSSWFILDSGVVATRRGGNQEGN